jgi:AAA domain
MKLGIVSTQNNGKTTLVNAIKERWPMYVSPEKTYRDLIKEKGLNLNQVGDIESQTVIRDALFEQAHAIADQKHSVSDRTILCNLIYTMYLYDKGRIQDDEFVYDSLVMCQEAMSKYDVIFWLPLNPDIKIVQEDNDNRDIDPVFRQEIDVLYQSMYEGWLRGSNGEETEKGGSPFFNPLSQPAIIPLLGNVRDKIETIELYLDDDGNHKTEPSILASLADEYDKMQLMDEVKAELKHQNKKKSKIII